MTNIEQLRATLEAAKTVQADKMEGRNAAQAALHNAIQIADQHLQDCERTRAELSAANEELKAAVLSGKLEADKAPMRARVDDLTIEHAHHASEEARLRESIPHLIREAESAERRVKGAGLAVDEAELNCAREEWALILLDNYPAWKRLRDAAKKQGYAMPAEKFGPLLNDPLIGINRYSEAVDALIYGGK